MYNWRLVFLLVGLDCFWVGGGDAGCESGDVLWGRAPLALFPRVNFFSRSSFSATWIPLFVHAKYIISGGDESCGGAKILLKSGLFSFGNMRRQFPAPFGGASCFSA